MQSNRCYGSPDIKATQRTQKQRDRSNLGGALAPPMPWRPRTRGETLLPSREEVKEEEDEGAPSSLLFRWPQNVVVAIVITAIFTNNFTVIITNSSPLYAALSLTRCNLYLNMVLNAIYYFPMMYGYPMMFE